MAVVVFADCPEALMHFCHYWGVQNPFTRPVQVKCAGLGCDAVMPLAFATDVEVSDRDCKAFLVFEMMHRGWGIMDGRPYCPTCSPP